jgi:glycosyltransferase involved in cell wall biosynthesis
MELARHLTRAGDVTVIAPQEMVALPSPLSAQVLGTAGAYNALRAAEIVITQGFNLRLTELARIRGRLVVDSYDPLPIELLEHYRHTQLDPWHLAKVAAVQRYLLRRGDFFICASERQRAFWLGALLREGRLTPAATRADPSLRTFIDIVPFGLPDEAPEASGPHIEEAFPAISPRDPVLLWNGGIWNWLDPATAIRGVALALSEVPNLRLVFLGSKHPTHDVPPSEAAQAASALARELGLLNRHIFFYTEWLPYEQRTAFLLRATAAICLHADTPESSLSFRTRLLDCLWASVPILCSDGDYFADVVRNHGIGRVVPPQDASAVAAAIRDLVTPQAQSDCRARVHDVAPLYTWSRAVEPLLRYCLEWPGPSTFRAAEASALARLAGELTVASFRHGRWQRLPLYARRELRALGRRTRF